MIISIEKLNHVLFALLGSEDLVNKWWSRKNAAFDMDTPMNVYISDPHRVCKYILNQLDH